ncbi:MAG: VCBS repeat-containing protein [Myxococcales bacterium]|nr:VCBS repeat-containing protein [Myxococcales bacterium]
MSPAERFSLVDLDGDGYDDLVFSDGGRVRLKGDAESPYGLYPGLVVVLRGDGTGKFSRVSPPDLRGRSFAKATLPNGRPGLAVLRAGKVVFYTFTNGEFGAAPAADVTLEDPNGRSLEVGDFDGDGLDDLAVLGGGVLKIYAGERAGLEGRVEREENSPRAPRALDGSRRCLRPCVPARSFHHAPPRAGGGAVRGPAKTQFSLGAQAYSTARYDVAVVAFAEAYRLLPRPEILFSLAQAEKKQCLATKDGALLKKALKHFREYYDRPERLAEGRRRSTRSRSLSPCRARQVMPSPARRRPPSPHARPRGSRCTRPSTDRRAARSSTSTGAAAAICRFPAPSRRANTTFTSGWRGTCRSSAT